MAATTPATSPASLRSLYRTLSRSIRRSSAASTFATGSKRTVSPLQHYIRDVLTSTEAGPSTSTLPFGGPSSSGSSGSGDIDVRQRTLANLASFLHNKTRYLDLLERYNPSHGMSEEERVRLTARRVGLDVPITHNPLAAASSSTATTAGGDMAADHEGAKILSTNESLFRQGAQLAAGETDAQKKRREDLYSGKGDGLNRGGPLAPPGSAPFAKDD
ncbi:uncharacterized protein PFL1_02528 [Pseudozyma flocculosa PF-1]|uniref:Related to FMC1 - mitochondrial matrix protein, required for assembly of F1F0 ATP synthase n=2 Tax=Pseudozyma flocculosa TaxID=84751 RepID=A0A5C3F1K3_9BASI|nr:uncharacterized protein PFL1_02528 [Pseudozyma flocculosa PF-1]EPQ29855.1 hypothetical protein PFL1_02528 [Pseudozyma flocculosa PF-1]SPO37151.1 related to FMC1 - mitochondrial matrix protein, required for assembly of F1F0 ATP synthase [Pseudozyma flocculosa]